MSIGAIVLVVGFGGGFLIIFGFLWLGWDVKKTWGEDRVSDWYGPDKPTRS